MKEFLENPGLDHIAIHISRHLDPKSLASCRLVSHSWRNLIDNDRPWLVFQLNHIQNTEKSFIDCNTIQIKGPTLKSTIAKRFPEWTSVIEQFTKRQKIIKLQGFVEQMWIYFKDDEMIFYTNPLHDAARKSNITFVELLINAGVDLSMKNPTGSTPFHYACQQGNIEMVELLLKNQPKYDISLDVQNAGFNPLRFAIQNVDNPDVAIYLLKMCPLMINFVDQRGGHTLHHACIYGHLEFVKHVCENSGFNIYFDVVDGTGMTPLHYICRRGDLDLLKYLFEISDLHLDFNVLDNSGITPMVHAAQNGHLKVVKYLIENIRVDVDFNVVIDGHDPFQYICLGGKFEVVKYFLENYASSINCNIANSLGCLTTSFKLKMLKFFCEKPNLNI